MTVVAASCATGVVLTLGPIAPASLACQIVPDAAAAAARQPAQGAAATHARKGVDAWVFNGVNRALTKSGATWYYTWGPDHHGITSPHGVSFVPMIWGAGSDFVTSRAVGELKSYLKAIHARYQRPLWLTEFALIRFGTHTTFPSAQQQAAFVTAATSMLRGLSYVQRYAWFALPATSGDGTAGLFHPGAVATRAGHAFEAVHP